MQQFKTLMLREWLQQRQSWLRMAILIPLIGWAILYLFVLKLGIPVGFYANHQPLFNLAIFGLVGQSSLIAVISLIGVLIHIPSLAYRDIDDKSLAFWRSLPVNDGQAVAAPLLMNAIVLPLLSISTAFALGLFLSAPLWLSGLQSDHIQSVLLAFTRVIWGAALGLIWFLPLVLVLAVGNSLVRRWGILLALIAVYVCNNMMSNLIGITPIGNQIDVSMSMVSQLLLPFENDHPSLISSQLSQLPAYIFNLHFLQTIVSIIALVAVLVWQRQRGITA
ncbi:hypothetical protein [Deefgea salmonis]|uniref:ABC transporter permease n=1 Tax=Deefgea salmonis TaxID=2875502 RepID=A0ABS8BN41_9NEIS|nr:hypothetical protein [Deefgea salmonis]MCB5197157.1 hypothetical protein [Deefgea salmonis]